ncbi:hypothetical protein [Clostridium taeniosporum]|uniref:Uncharacterized protein n=1 Tax=Clostridium taeniosporum TaxID=394958 RepID=A0A1D7XP69_9CLOT|nr:hypothetical protein [Clostridium taeniosporum]AOR25116.1 hypothetical protein BGI42_15345 [Clostridium taeniosporum]
MLKLVYSFKLVNYNSIISIILSLITFIYDDTIQRIIINLIIILVQTIALIVSIFLIEKELKNNFDENRNRRNS